MAFAPLRALFVVAVLAAPPALDKPAGTVVAVSGDVTAAAPGGAVRKLSVKDVVSGQDEITTSKMGAVTVRFEFNNVLWTLRGGLKRRVSDSLAWTAPVAAKNDPLFSNVPDGTGLAAGRDGTIGAAQSVAALHQAASPGASASSAVAPSPSGAHAVAKTAAVENKPPSPPRQASAQPPPPPPPEADMSSPDVSGGKAGEAPPKAEPVAADRLAGVPGASGGGAAVGGVHGVTPAENQVATSAPDKSKVQKPQTASVNGPVNLSENDKKKDDRRDEADRSAASQRRTGAAGAGVTTTVEDAGGRTPASLDVPLNTLRVKVRAVVPPKAHVVVRVVIAPDGTVSDFAFDESSGMTLKAHEAVVRALQELRLPAGAAAATIRLEVGAETKTER